MKKILVSRISLILVIVFAIWFIYKQNKKNENLDLVISNTGNYSYSRITKKIVTSGGGTRSIEYLFNIEEKKYSWERYVSQEYFKNHQIGDTIIIKVLKSELPYSLICEDVDYKTCFGKQPLNGWKELPKCE